MIAVDVPAPADPLDRRLTSERGAPTRRPLRWPGGIAHAPGLAAAVLEEQRTHGHLDRVQTDYVEGDREAVIAAAQLAADEATAKVARVRAAHEGATEADEDGDVAIAPAADPPDLDGCGPAMTADQFAAACGVDLDAPTAPTFTLNLDSAEEAAAYERWRAATRALHAAEVAHREQAAALHAAVLAPAQAEFRAALQALTQSIAPGAP